MNKQAASGPSAVEPAVATGAAEDAIAPRSFADPPQANDLYLGESAAAKLAEFFQAKGLAALKEEDRGEQWHEDWLAYQAQHRLYASLLSPRQYSTLGGEFDLLKLTRFLEVFAYFSPAHGYSLQTTFLGLFAILMGSNADLKREAIVALEAGGLLAFGISEKDHGSDLLGNEFTVKEISPGRFVANGSKYYIGNANCAAMIAILARKEDARSARRAATPTAASTSSHRAPIVLFALRPDKSAGYRNVRKIRTLGVRAAFVGGFDVKDHELTPSDFIAESRRAWDAIFGTVSLGKFFLGFGSIGICEHALEEALAHLRARTLYRKPVLDMPHIRFAAAQAYARLSAMKLYAYRALDYVQVASATDRRYLLFAAVQKAKVSTEGAKVMAQLSECIGAKGFESDTYFESALRDIQLIPGLEGSTHINLTQTAQFMPRYFAEFDADLPDPKSLTAGEVTPQENAYLFEARTGVVNDIAFAHFLSAYQSLMHVPNVRVFVRQAKAFRLVLGAGGDNTKIATSADLRVALALGQCTATIAYAQLIAENAVRLKVATPMISAIFHLLISDLSAAAAALAALPGQGMPARALARLVFAVPKTADADWDFASDKMEQKPRSPGAGPLPGSPAATPASLDHTPNHQPDERSMLWSTLRIPAWILTWLLFDLKVYGREHVPKRGGVLIVCNHQSNLDPVLMGVRLDRPLNYIAKSQLFSQRFGRWLLTSLNAFPVRLGKGDVAAIKQTIERLQQGHLVNLYPEGRRTSDGEIQPLQRGVALIIKRAGVRVIPAVIIGAYDAWPIHRRFPRPAPVRIQFGPAMDLAGLESEEAITAAIDSQLRGMFEQLQRQSPRS